MYDDDDDGIVSDFDRGLFEVLHYVAEETCAKWPKSPRCTGLRICVVCMARSLMERKYGVPTEDWDNDEERVKASDARWGLRRE